MNIPTELLKMKDLFSPKVIGEVNDTYIKLAKIKGDKVPWHNHKNEDELFYILHGSLVMEIEHMPPFEMCTGDLFIVKRGINHRVSSKKECCIMLVENKSTQHTGTVQNEITKSIDTQLDARFY